MIGIDVMNKMGFYRILRKFIKVIHALPEMY